ncbi:hypothetical protein GCM10009664_37210 [Kitasatospora gansuensis]
MVDIAVLSIEPVRAAATGPAGGQDSDGASGQALMKSRRPGRWMRTNASRAGPTDHVKDPWSVRRWVRPRRETLMNIITVRRARGSNTSGIFRAALCSEGMGLPTAGS